VGEGAGEAPVSAEVREAVVELQQYLSDRVPPLMVVDSVALLVHQPPQLLAAEIGAWVAYQRPAAPDLSVADLLFHGAKKIALMGELDLVPKPDIAHCLGGVTEALLPQCPEEDRELLRQNLNRLRNASLAGTAADPVPILDRQPGSDAARTARAAQAPAATLSPEATRGLRRLSLFLERLQPLGGGTMVAAGPAGGTPAYGTPAAGIPSVAGPLEQRREVASQFMTAAAVQATVHPQRAAVLGFHPHHAQGLRRAQRGGEERGKRAGAPVGRAVAADDKVRHAVALPEGRGERRGGFVRAADQVGWPRAAGPAA